MEQWVLNFLHKLLLLLQTKKIAYLSTVFTGCFCLVFSLRGTREITMVWVSAFTVLTGFVTTGYLGGKYLMRNDTSAKQ